MDDEERKWQRFEEYVRQVEEEQQGPQPDLFFQRSIGCFIGGILGPVLLFGLFCISATLYPNEPVGDPLALLILLIMAVPVGGIFFAIMSPLIVKWINEVLGRNDK